MMFQEQQQMSDHKKKKQSNIDEETHEDEDYKDDFEEIDEEIEVEEEAKHLDKRLSDEDSIEEDLNLDVDEDSDSGSDLENQMDKFKTQKQHEDISKMKPPVHASGKKRAISAKYELKSSKSSNMRSPNIRTDKTSKNTVIQALQAENKKLATFEEDEKRMKAETKKSRPFSTIMSTKDKQASAKTRQPKVNTKLVDVKVNRTVDDTSSATDFERYEGQSEDRHAKDSHPSFDTQMRKTDIMMKIEKLNNTQRQQLFFLLEQMESGKAFEKIDMKFLSPKPTMVKSTKPVSEASVKLESERSYKNEIRIRALSTWGHIQVGGLTEIELFDVKGNKLLLVPADIIIKNAGKII
jgi:hypothetical protein